MNRRGIGHAAAFLAALWLVDSPGRATEETTPTDVVRLLYAEPHPTHAAVYTKRLQALFDGDARRASNGLDFDYRLNHEPVSGNVLKDLSFVETRSGPNRSEVDVSLVDSRPQRIVYTLVRENGAWRVEDARSLGEPSWRLSDLLTGESH